MEERNANVIFGKAGGNASKNSYTCKISIPKTWMNKMGISVEKREVTLSFDEDRVIIEKSDSTGISKRPLANKRKIRRFALVWLQMYKNHESIPGIYFEDIEFVGKGLSELGFEMDCGSSLEELFPSKSIFEDNAAFKNVIDQIDLQTLGNAIFSQWRYFNHWNNAPMNEENFQWFVIAFSRLAELSE